MRSLKRNKAGSRVRSRYFWLVEVIKHRLEELKEEDLMLCGKKMLKTEKKTDCGSSKVSARQPVGIRGGGERAWPRLISPSVSMRVEGQRCLLMDSSQRSSLEVQFVSSFYTLKPQGGVGKQAKFYRSLSGSLQVAKGNMTQCLHCLPGQCHSVPGRK